LSARAAGSPPAAEVTVLTQPECPLCEHATAVLARVEGDFSLVVRHIALSSAEGRALAERHRVLFAPGVFLDGQLVSYGRLSERRLRRQLTRSPERGDRRAAR
jgi:glutaredoxin